MRELAKTHNIPIGVAEEVFHLFIQKIAGSISDPDKKEDGLYNKDKFKTETARINTRKRKFRRKSGSEISSREDSLKKALDKDRSGSADTVFNSKEFQDIPTKDLRNMITKLKKRKEVE